MKVIERTAVPANKMAALVRYINEHAPSSERNDESDTERVPLLDDSVQWELDLFRARAGEAMKKFLEESFLLERLVVERRVAVRTIKQINDSQDAVSLKISLQTMRARMKELEDAWGDNVRIEVGEPTMQGVDVTFTVNGVDLEPSLPSSLSSSA